MYEEGMTKEKDICFKRTERKTGKAIASTQLKQYVNRKNLYCLVPRKNLKDKEYSD